MNQNIEVLEGIFERSDNFNLDVELSFYNN